MIPNFIDIGDFIYRGGQPTSNSDWDFLKSIGVTQVIKLNLDSEGSDEYWTKLGGLLFKVPQNIIEQTITEPDIDNILTAVEFITKGTFVHCTHGQDRTGLVIAAYRLKQGWTKDAVLQEMKVLGFHNVLLGLDKALFDILAKFSIVKK